MATRMQQRRGTADQWLTADPVLDVGEIGFETDTNSFKIGDGVNSWTLLDYFTNETGLAASLEDYILATEKAAPNGVATLDANGFVPAEQLDIDLTAYYTSAEVDAEIAAIPAPDYTGLATETYADTAAATAAAAVVDAAPGTLDTLNELAAALGDDANFATTVTNSLAAKADTSVVDAALLTKKTEVVQSVSSDITLVAGYRYLVDTSAVRTLTLPASPVSGAEVQIFDTTNTASANNITVNNGGSLINGVSDVLVIDVNGAVATLVYTGSTLGWRI
jgi:hypothetical protein